MTDHHLLVWMLRHTADVLLGAVAVSLIVIGAVLMFGTVVV